MRALTGILALATLVLLGAVLLFPVFPSDGVVSKPSVCLSNVKQSSLGLILYAGDENDRFPLRDTWMDATYPYVKSEPVRHCPSVPKGVYGYAFNGALSGAKAPGDPVAVPMVYESVDPIRNASDLVTSLPSPGRHNGRDTMAYADGHARGMAVR